MCTALHLPTGAPGEEEYSLMERDVTQSDTNVSEESSASIFRYVS